jgi:transcriptional regulator with XRE-family HTH domain
MTPAQCRAARALLDMTYAELAMASIVSRDMIADFETGTRTPSATDMMAMRQVSRRSASSSSTAIGRG